MTCSGATPLTVSPRCRRPKSGPGVDAELARRSSASKRPGRVVLDDRVAVGAAAMVDGERRDR